jgi:hypothetical protein
MVVMALRFIKVWVCTVARNANEWILWSETPIFQFYLVNKKYKVRVL